MKLIMLGAPGAGKGTQAKMLAKEYEIPHISTGDIFRANIKGETPLGMEAKAYMDKGQLVPDSLTINMVLDRLTKEDCKEGYILDGFPRTIPQAICLDEALQKNNETITFAINVDVPDENIIARMSGRRACLTCGATYHVTNVPPQKEGICDICGGELVLREDDKPETVKARLQVYHQQTKPLIEYFEKQNLLLTVDGTKDVESVFGDITRALGA